MAGHFVGFQLANMDGENIQGDDDDPTGFSSFEIMTPPTAVRVMSAHRGFLLMPIYDGDIEEPSFV